VTLTVSQTFGHFEIKDLLQKGGMGEVYRALDTNSGDEVALKLLAPKYQGNDYVTGRFLAEADVYRRLSHPNIVRYIDSGKVDERYYIALEHIVGVDLAQLIERDGAIDIDLAMSVMVDVTFAVNYAHGKEIVHRDLKPQNIMVTRDHEIKLIDFGVAHARNDYVNTDAGMVLGSLCYNSPEQNQGKLVDYRSDIYSLGLVFYEIVTGKRLLPNTSVSDIILSQVELDHTIVPPRFLNEACPVELQDIIIKMCRFDPRDRYQKLEQVLLALKELGKKRTGGLSTDAMKSKALADRDLADTHYWKGMNCLSEGLYLEALDEFEALLSLSLYHHQAYIAQVEEQVNFLSWTLDLCCEGTVSAEDEMKSVELDVLRKLSEVYSENPGNGIRNAMRSLLGFYKDRVREIKEKRKQQVKDRKVPITPDQYPLVIQKLGTLYQKLGRYQQQRLMVAKITAFAERMDDAAQGRTILDGLRRDLPDDEYVLHSYLRFLFRRGYGEEALHEALALGRQHRLKEAWNRALAVYKEVLEYNSGNAEAKAAIDEIHATLADIAEETERLCDLTQKMVSVQDYNSAINMCIKFMNDYPENPTIKDKLADLYLAKDDPRKAFEQLLGLGMALYDRGDYDQAKTAFAKALPLQPENQECINYLVEIMKRDDPSLCDRNSPKAIVEEIYLRLGLYDRVVTMHKAKLKGSPADLRTWAKIIDILQRSGDREALLEAKVDKIVCAIEQGDMQTANEEVDAFGQAHPDEVKRLERLKKLSFETKLRVRDTRIRELLG